MIFCDSLCAKKADQIENLIAFVQQLRPFFPNAFFHPGLVEQEVPSRFQMETLPFMVHKQVIERKTSDTGLLLTNAHKSSAHSIQVVAERYKGQCDEILAIGHFKSEQEKISLTQKLVYQFGLEPQIEDASEFNLFGKVEFPLIAKPPSDEKMEVRKKSRLGVLFPDLKDAFFVNQVQFFSRSNQIEIHIISNGKGKEEWIDRYGYEVPSWHLGEVNVEYLAKKFSALAVFSYLPTWYKANALIASFCARGTAVFDCTIDQKLNADYPGFIPGTRDLNLLHQIYGATHLAKPTSRNRGAYPSDGLEALEPPQYLKQFFQRSEGKTVTETTITPERLKKRRNRERRITFLPTNGVGMGHAKRCSLIANELSKDYDCNFAVFPSCIPMVTGYGFDAAPLVTRSLSSEFADPDIINYTRLERLTRESDILVFDGGYVFDSIVRSIVDNKLDAFWIRRGLWSSNQNNSIALDRQKYFNAVFVPTEAFDELNQSMGSDRNVFNVGPIVQKINRTKTAVRKLRKGLFKHASRDYDKILVSMLGGGVASDRGAQLATIINCLYAKSNVLHVIVVWPGAKIDPQIYSREDTLVLRTFSAAVLLAAADLFVSAVGYNSFHEVIYNHIPTIFIPQVAGYMDDQRTRAQAAVTRGLADMVEPWEHRKLGTLIDKRLSDGCMDLMDAMEAVKLPKAGQSQFKSILEEVRS